MKLRIVNLSKFIRSILIIFGIILLISIFMSNTTLSHGDVTYKEIYISEGDTLWSIAAEQKENNEYYQNKDIRDIINNIKTINKLSNSNLNVHQKLQIPTVN